LEVFYTFTRAPRSRQGQGPRKFTKPDAKPRRGKGGPKGKGAGKQGGKGGDRGPKTHSSRPPKTDKPIDPDNPFAALMALKNKG
jgi:ATP-dependent RNA helicase SUPV3L1/SUV3